MAGPRVKGSFLLLLLGGIEEGLTPKQIAKKLGKTKQALNYHLNRMQALKLVFREQSYPFSIYKLTDLGHRVKDSLIESEPLPSLWKAHNLIVGFKIRRMGSFNFCDTRDRKIISMTNWRYAREEIDGHIVNIQDTGLLKIYCKAEYTRDPDIAFGKMFSDAARIAQLYADRYGMALEPLEVIRKGEKSLCNSEQLSKIFGRFKIAGVYVNASDGPEELEEAQDVYSVENLLKLPQRVDQLEQHLVKQTLIMSDFSKNIELHLGVLRELKDAVKEFREAREDLKGRN